MTSSSAGGYPDVKAIRKRTKTEVAPTESESSREARIKKSTVSDDVKNAGLDGGREAEDVNTGRGDSGQTHNTVSTGHMTRSRTLTVGRVTRSRTRSLCLTPANELLSDIVQIKHTANASKTTENANKTTDETCMEYDW